MNNDRTFTFDIGRGLAFYVFQVDGAWKVTLISSSTAFRGDHTPSAFLSQPDSEIIDTLFRPSSDRAIPRLLPPYNAVRFRRSAICERLTGLRKYVATAIETVTVPPSTNETPPTEASA